MQVCENGRRASIVCWAWRRHVRDGEALEANVRAAMRGAGWPLIAVAMRALHLLGAAISCVCVVKPG